MARQERDTFVKTPTPPMSNPEMMTRPGMTTEVRHPDVVSGPVTWEEMRALMKQEAPFKVPERTWRPTTGGILLVLAGSWNTLLGLGAVLSTTLFSSLFPTFGISAASTVSLGIGFALIVLGIVSIIGGAVAISRRAWGLSLAGAITALIPSPIILPFIFGILGLIFITLGHLEFRGTDKVAAQR
jgi:hypothetical protein